MSDGWSQETSSSFPHAAPVSDAATAGTLLRRAREAAGLHVAALAVSLKVPVRKLEALEDDRYELLPDAVFVRALASSVCRTLKIDPQPILDRLPQTAAPRLVRDSDGINTPFRAPSDGAPPTWVDQMTRPVFLAVFALLLGALVLLLLPAAHKDDAGAQSAKGAPEVASLPPSVAENPQAAQAPAPMPVPVAIAPATVAVAPAAETPTPAPAVAAPAVAAPKPAASSAAAAMPAASAALAVVPASSANGIVVLRAKGESWVEVTDAKGVVAVRKLLAAGEVAGASGALPLQVTIGRVDATEVQVRGKSFDLRPVSKDNVARFEVK